MNYYLRKNPFSKLFIAIEIALFIFIHFANVPNGRIVCFTSILLCLIFATTEYKNKAVAFEILALLFTVISDVFLVLLRARQQGLAMTFFSIAQLFHFAFIFSNQTSVKERKRHIIVRITTVLTAIIITTVVLRDKTDYVSIISMFYFANLIVNVIYAFKNYNAFPMLAIGLFLFIMCDVVVGLQSATGVYLNIEEGSTLYNILHPGIDLAWIFYPPSQTLIALNVKYFHKRK